MKTLFFTTLLILNISANAASLDDRFKTRIEMGCIQSVEKGGKKILNHQDVCRCIAETHFKAAVQEVKQSEAIRQIEWVSAFYEATDMTLLQKMVDKNPMMSGFDDQVVDDCISSENQRTKK